MSSMNRVFLAGNLTRDPELKQTGTGMAVADLGVAVNDNYKNRNGEEVERVCFADVVVWGRQAETCSQYLAKGAAVLVEGSLQLDRWENAEGQPRSKMKIRANRVQFIGRGHTTSETSATAEPGAVPVSEGADIPEADMPF
ncbi:MAG: single-stranded DNA-binding protein [Verrucomicrobia bacterium]|jgi:single-strand DNA-binding protein|nr:single-stranded DNA-binding protein [Verrucomicrobiota bacterium]MBT7068389.1 single-stranded DNA-binding protein [Verrucomicrobiota bacterium]MBT7698901.1 single-stranded DNA-binding protein [Verrucomicrobiota bacterium]